MFRTLQNASSKLLHVETLILSTLVFKAVLKHQKTKFYKICISFFLGPLKLPDFMINDTNL